MRRSITVLLVLCALLAVGTAAVWAAQADQPGSAQLELTEISWDLAQVYQGDQPTIRIVYENQGTAPVPDAVSGVLWVALETQGDPAEVAYKSDEVELEAAGLEPEESREQTIDITAPTAGRYRLVANLRLGEEEPKTLDTEFTVTSSLPPELARLFAGLAVFAAMMAIMAVGTEVVIDSFKLMLGMKQKVTALEALDQLKKELPGQLADLGVDPESQKQVEELFVGLEVTLKPVDDVTAIYNAVKDGDFGTAFDEIKTLEASISDLDKTIEDLNAKLDQVSEEEQKELKKKRKSVEKELNKKLNELKEKAKNAVGDVLAKVQPRLERFGMNEAVVNQIKHHLQAEIDKITIKDILDSADYAADWLGTILQEIQTNGAEWAADWLRSQVDTYLKTGRKAVDDALNDELVPALRAMGFPANTVNMAKDALVSKIDGLEGVVREKTATYTLAIQNLLLAVEERRNLMQSPARKIWRRLRGSDQLSIWGVLLGLAVGVTGLSFACWAQFSGKFLGRVGIAAAGVLIGGLVAWLMSLLILGGWPESWTLGQVVAGIETICNKIMRREEEASRFGKVDAEVQKNIEQTGPITVAKVLLEREDKHRDEEASRIRILRVISVFVGLSLAYMLQIDALGLLEQAFPGAAKFNIILLRQKQLQSVWAALSYDLRVGIVLTGLAASAGSKFWRDLLGRLQATKQQAESAAVFLRKGKAMIGLEQEQQ